MDLVPGAQVERYVVESRIGAGRMSTSYRARHATLDTLHALSIPNMNSRGLIARMVAGAKIQAKLRHPNVVAVTDVLDLDGLPVIVMDHVDGPSLEEFAKNHDLDETSLDALAAGLFDAIGWLHRNSVVHRNLKPRNIIVDVGGESVQPRITDFTLARVLGQGKPRKRKKPRVFGTPQFMSPEQSRDSDAVDHRSDLWSLGCLLYFLCTGEPPFDGPPEVVFSRLRSGVYLPLKRVISSAPSRWVASIDAALVVDPRERAGSAEQLADLWFEGVEERPRMSAKSAPVGRVTLVFTDVQGSTRIWEQEPEVARLSLKAHDAVIRNAIHRTGGYEVKTEGDAFMVAFSHPARAIRFCLEVQRDLHNHPWDPALLALAEARTEDGFRGLRVRMGVHIGTPEARPMGDRVDYYGQMVNRAARIASAGHGGQVLVSGEAWRAGRRKVKDELITEDLGSFQLRGLSGNQRLIQVVPAEFAARSFPAIKARPVG